MKHLMGFSGGCRDPEFNQTTRGHLNLALSLEMEEVKSGSLHGVLGQTTPDRAPVASFLPEELQVNTSLNSFDFLIVTELL
jgi:hypothetical protein